MNALPRTYGLARVHTPLDEHDLFLPSVAQFPLLVVGSGGSMTAAHFAAALHERSCLQFAKACTPVGMAGDPNISGAAVMLISASGRNQDILGAYDQALRGGARLVMVVTCRQDSPLTRRVESTGRGSIYLTPGPAQKDGYLATNTLLSTLVCLIRLYDPKVALPRAFEGLVHARTFEAFTRRIARDAHRIGRRANLVALFAEAGRAAALDLESRCSEAALAAVQCADYRNFAHGRHLWLDRFPSETAVVSFGTSGESQLAEATRKFLPPGIPYIRLASKHETPICNLSLVAQGIALVGLMGENRGSDPGRPHVAKWGRRLYHASPQLPNPRPPITRKAFHLSESDHEDSWIRAREVAIRHIESTPVEGLLLDYDGTIVDSTQRYESITRPISREIRRLALEGLPMGIATGRGDSIIKPLREVVPENCWHRILVGAYNGAVSFRLSQSPIEVGPDNPDITSFQEWLNGLGDLFGPARIRSNSHRISIIPEGAASLLQIWNTVHEEVIRHRLPLEAYLSSHSVDIYPSSTTKADLLAAMVRTYGASADGILRIGDRGRWPGNDFELLDHPMGLSVDEPSTSARGCWDLAPPQLTGSGALHYYLKCLVLNSITNQWRLRLPSR